MPSTPRAFVAGFVVLALALVGCGGGKSEGTSRAEPGTSASPAEPVVLWPAPSNALGRAVAASLQPEVKESLTFHVHAHLDVFVEGNPIVVPSGIGINIDDPGVRKFTDTPDGSIGYGGIKQCDQPCISPLHTHDTTGILHTEAKTPDPNTLGQFFTEWGVRLTDSCAGDYCSPKKPVAVYVDGKRYEQDPREIQLTFEKEIAIVIGKAPATIPKTADFSNA
jgi:hypothetical protein